MKKWSVPFRKNIYTTCILNMAFVLLLLPSMLSCKKEGEGGKASIKGRVLHHDTPIPGATVMIKYGAKEIPGVNQSDYDQLVTATLSDASYSFENLRVGNYYLYSTGYDSSIMEIVTGGIPVTIKSKKEIKETNVPVTE